MTDPTYDPSAAYYIALSDEERANMERWAFNFREATGHPMKIPPALYDDLKRAGVDMKNIEPSAKLEAHGLRPELK